MAAPELETIRTTIRENYLADEGAALQRLAAMSNLSEERRQAISGQAAELVRSVRASGGRYLMESFLAEYGLSTQEGVALMCLAEALLRVPDDETVD